MRGARLDPERLEVRTLLRHAPLRGSILLDVGCGDGRLTRRLAPLVRSAVGIDPDPHSVARARTRLRRWQDRVRLEVGRAEALSFPDATFTAVLFSWSL